MRILGWGKSGRRGRLYEKERPCVGRLSDLCRSTHRLPSWQAYATRRQSFFGWRCSRGHNRRSSARFFCNVVLANAFLDIEATMQNQNLHLTQHEWDEYGNPLEDSIAAEAIDSYCHVTKAYLDSSWLVPWTIGRSLHGILSLRLREENYAERLAEKLTSYCMLKVKAGSCLVLDRILQLLKWRSSAVRIPSRRRFCLTFIYTCYYFLTSSWSSRFKDT
jgi:hypothetical protein